MKREPPKTEHARYSATRSRNQYLGDCVSIAYQIDQERYAEDGLTGGFVLFLIKTKKEQFPFLGTRLTLLGRKSFLAERVPLRVMSSCLTGLIGDTMCDCADDMARYLRLINKLGEGIFVYVPQEGQGRDIRTKIRDHRLQYGFNDEDGRIPNMTFSEATRTLFPDEHFDLRGYHFLKECFSELGIDTLPFSWLGGQRRMEQVHADTGFSLTCHEYGDAV